MRNQLCWGIDIGVGSLALAVIELDGNGIPVRVIDGVAEIFTPSTGAAERQSYRAMRHQNQRTSSRLNTLRRRLIDVFDLASDFDRRRGTRAGTGTAHASPVTLRDAGLKSALEPEDLARAIMHIAGRRGQRLKRTGAAGDDTSARATAARKEATETQARASGTAERLRMLGETLGLGRAAHPAELLAMSEREGGPTRLRKEHPNAPVFTRHMMRNELDCLLETQAPAHASVLSPDIRAEIHTLVFQERPAKEPRVGRCRYGVREANGAIEERLGVGADLFQTKRIYEEINNLRLIDPLSGASRPLELDERDRLAKVALAGRDLTGGTVRTVLGLGRARRSMLTSLDVREGAKGRKSAGKIKGHRIAAAFAKARASDVWDGLSPDLRQAAADALQTRNDFETARDRLAALGLREEQASIIANEPIGAARSAAGQTATRRILDALRAAVIDNGEAAARAGLSESNAEAPRLDRLPYYGVLMGDRCVGATQHPAHPLEQRYGRIPNPVVHQALNRLRKMANAFLKRYGKPARICVELARDLNKSPQARAQDEKRARENGRKNDNHARCLLHGSKHGMRRLSKDDLLKIKLHRLQDGRCLYTGKELSADHLFDGSTAIDHILPRAETLDDGVANLALALASANNYKAKRCPHDAFHAGYAGRDYASILDQAKARGPGVFWRFQPDAMTRFAENADFQARFLNDTRDIARVARRYLDCVCEVPNGVICVNGRMTALLRRHWGLDNLVREVMVEDGVLDRDRDEKAPDRNTETQLKERRARQAKLRLDHRHHLLDAITVGCVTRGDVGRINTVAARFDRAPKAKEIADVVREYLTLFPGAGLPWTPGFRSHVKAILVNDPTRLPPTERPASRVLRRADHNPLGPLHAASSYGAICRDPTIANRFVVRQHKSLMDLTGDPKMAQKIEKLDDIGGALTVARAAEAARAAGDEDARIWWGGSRPSEALLALKASLAELKRDILNRADNAPPETARTQSDRLKWAIAKTVESGRRRYTKVSVMSARILKPGTGVDKRPLTLSPTKTDNSNYCLDLFRDISGDIGWRVVARLDANQADGMALGPGKTLLMRLRAGDLVEMLRGAAPDAARKLYQLVSLSPGDVQFQLVEDARAYKQAPPSAAVRISSLGELRKRRPAHVVLDPAGRVRWRSAPLN